MPRSVRMPLAGWGNFRPADCDVFRPERQSELRDIVTHAGASTDPSDSRHDLIARGLGRSYGDSAVNAGGGVMLQQRLNRFLAFDPASGVLECEAGVSFAEIIATFLPRGFFLPVTPGTKFVTVGGAIAADVHGKNHHVDGTLGRHILSLDLLTADGQTLACSPTQNSEAFWATVGGMGLTGIILSARIRLLPIPSAYIKVRYQQAANLDEALEQFSAGDAGYRYSVAWIDCLAAGASLGRSVLIRGDHAESADLLTTNRSDPLALPPQRGRSVPFNFPGWALNRHNVRLFNAAYYARHGDREAVVGYDSFFYPLDGVQHWNRIYGKRGFVQYQALFPTHTSRAGLIEMLERLSSAGGSSFLAVLKTTGPAGEGVLSFPFAGHTLALDLPNTGESLTRLVADLDRVLLKHEGRLYLAKDSCMDAATFAAMYPNAARFRLIKDELDPKRRFSSSQARRVGLC